MLIVILHIIYCYGMSAHSIVPDEFVEGYIISLVKYASSSAITSHQPFFFLGKLG